MPATSGSSVPTREALLSWSLSIATRPSMLAWVATRLALRSDRAVEPSVFLQGQLLVLGHVEQGARHRVDPVGAVHLVVLRQGDRGGAGVHQRARHGLGAVLGRRDVHAELVGLGAVDVADAGVDERHRLVQVGVEDVVRLLLGADREHVADVTVLLDGGVAVDVRAAAVDQLGGAPVEGEGARDRLDRQLVGLVVDVDELVPHRGRGRARRGVALDRVRGFHVHAGHLGQLGRAEIGGIRVGQRDRGVLVQRELDHLPGNPDRLSNANTMRNVPSPASTSPVRRIVPPESSHSRR